MCQIFVPQKTSGNAVANKYVAEVNKWLLDAVAESNRKRVVAMIDSRTVIVR